MLSDIIVPGSTLGYLALGIRDDLYLTTRAKLSSEPTYNDFIGATEGYVYSIAYNLGRCTGTTPGSATPFGTPS